MIRTGVGKPKRIRAASSQGVYRAVLNSLLNDGNTVADYRADTGVTGTLAVSSWANQLGSAPALAQGTTANQPIYLPFSGQKYAWRPGLAANYFSTPASAANKITGDICIALLIAADDFTPSSAGEVVSRAQSTTNRSYYWTMGTDGKLSFTTSPDGTAGTQVAATSDSAPTVSDGSYIWLLVYRDVDNGSAGNDTKFFTSTDISKEPEAATWTQLGATKTNVGTTSIFAGTSILEIGSVFAGAADHFVAGKYARCKIWNGIPAFIGGAASNTPVVDFNPESASETTTNGATWTSATGETWTLNCTGTKRAQIVGSAQLLLDGVNHEMGPVSFTLAQPATMYFVGQQPTWTLNETLFDGATTTNRMSLTKSQVSPNIRMFAGLAPVAENTNWALNQKNILAQVYNGASSSLQVAQTTATTGNPGTQSPSGFMLGNYVGGGFRANIQVNEIIIRNGADSAATRALIYQYLKAIHGTP